MFNQWFYENKFGGLNSRPTAINQTQNKVFLHFFEFWSQIFLEIEYNDSLRQCLTSSRGITHEKNWEAGANLGETDQNWARNQVFYKFFIFDSLVFLQNAQNNSLEQCLTTNQQREELRKKKLGIQNWAQNQVFVIFSGLHHQFYLILHWTATPPKK